MNSCGHESKACCFMFEFLLNCQQKTRFCFNTTNHYDDWWSILTAQRNGWWVMTTSASSIGSLLISLSVLPFFSGNIYLISRLHYRLIEWMIKQKQHSCAHMGSINASSQVFKCIKWSIKGKRWQVLSSKDRLKLFRLFGPTSVVAQLIFQWGFKTIYHILSQL